MVNLLMLTSSLLVSGCFFAQAKPCKPPKMNIVNPGFETSNIRRWTGGVNPKIFWYSRCDNIGSTGPGGVTTPGRKIEHAFYCQMGPGGGGYLQAGPMTLPDNVTSIVLTHDYKMSSPPASNKPVALSTIWGANFYLYDDDPGYIEVADEWRKFEYRFPTDDDSVLGGSVYISYDNNDNVTHTLCLDNFEATLGCGVSEFIEKDSSSKSGRAQILLLSVAFRLATPSWV